jgi:hypothetical protein
VPSLISLQCGRYSLLVLIPNSRTGLSQLISDLAGYSLRNVQKHLEFQEVEVSLPSFEVQTTTKPIEALNKVCIIWEIRRNIALRKSRRVCWLNMFRSCTKMYLTLCSILSRLMKEKNKFWKELNEAYFHLYDSVYVLKSVEIID